MNGTPDRETIRNELRIAHQAKLENKEGLARVCARRAAGWAIQINLNNKGITLDSPSAFEYIKHLKSMPENSERMALALEYLTQRVVKDSLAEDSYWPLPEIDLVNEARWVVEEMIGEIIDFNE